MTKTSTIVAIALLALLTVSAGAVEPVVQVAPDGSTVYTGVKIGDDGSNGSGIIAREYLEEAVSGPTPQPEPKTLKEHVLRHFEHRWKLYAGGAAALGGYGLVANNNGYWPFNKGGGGGGSAGRDQTQTQTTDSHARQVDLTLTAGGDVSNVQIIILQSTGAPESINQGASSPVTSTTEAPAK